MHNQDQIQAFVFASPEIEELLADNEINLAELLKQEGIQVDKGFAKDPTITAISGQKDPTGILIGTAAIIFALTPILSKTITAISRKNVVVHELVCVPVEDSKGNVVQDASGAPVLQWVTRARLLESSKSTDSNAQILLKGPVGFELSYSDVLTKTLPSGN